VSVRARDSKCTLLPQTREEDAVRIDAGIAMRATLTQESRAVRFADGPDDWRRAETLEVLTGMLVR
jgi:hypothetical protein